MQIWNTKYALSSGITLHDAEPSERTPILVLIRGNGKTTCDQYLHGEGKDWHRSKESAVVKAEEMRIKKIKSLKKQIIKLEQMKFE